MYIYIYNTLHGSYRIGILLRFSWYMFTNSSQAVGDLALFLEVLGPGVKMQAVFFQLTTFWLDLSLQFRGWGVEMEGGSWGTLRIRDDWGTLGKIRGITTPPSCNQLPRHQLPDDARRLAFAPVQSSEPFRPWLIGGCFT